MKLNEEPMRFGVIPKSRLDELMNGSCPCCGEPFTIEMRPELTGRCHTGPVFVSYWEGWLYVECGQCRKPIGRIEIKANSKITEAERLGYKLVKASEFEVGLVKNGRGIRTWWAKEFGGKMPTLDHPLVQEAIRITEEM